MIEPLQPLRTTTAAAGPEIRQLTAEEIQTLAPDFAPYGMPDPQTSTAVGIVDGGKVVAYQFLQLKLHIQPTKVEDGYSHLFSALCRKSEEVILQRCGPTWVYCFATPGRMAALAESRGMAVEPWTVLSKLVTPAVPVKPVIEFPHGLTMALTDEPFLPVVDDQGLALDPALREAIEEQAASMAPVFDIRAAFNASQEPIAAPVVEPEPDLFDIQAAYENSKMDVLFDDEPAGSVQ